MYKNNLKSVIQHLTSQGYQISCVFDVGAHSGKWTQLYEKLLPNSKFILFEPIQRIPNTIEHKSFKVLLSDKSGETIAFYSISGTGDSYYKEDTKVYDKCNVIKFTAYTLDDLIEIHNIPLPQLIKLDTQGSELDILKGATRAIKSVDILITEIAVLPYNIGAPTFTDYIEYLTNLNFIPVGLEKIHIIDNSLVQVDLVFLRKHIKDQYYGSNKLIKF